MGSDNARASVVGVGDLMTAIAVITVSVAGVTGGLGLGDGETVASMTIDIIFCCFSLLIHFYLCSFPSVFRSLLASFSHYLPIGLSDIDRMINTPCNPTRCSNFPLTGACNSIFQSLLTSSVHGFEVSCNSFTYARR